MDHASATDLKHRTAWHRFLEVVWLHQVDGIIVGRLDRAVWSVLHAAQTREPLKHWGVGLKSLQEAKWDTTSPMGEMMYDITMAYAQLEKSLISERVKAGIDHAKRQGKPGTSPFRSLLHQRAPLMAVPPILNSRPPRGLQC